MEDVADQLTRYGFTVFTPDYRVYERQKTSPYECVKDGCYFYRHLIDNALELGIDPKRIFLSGGSAGGGVALNVALSFRRPAGLVLFNPGYTSPEFKDPMMLDYLNNERSFDFPPRCDGYADMFLIDPFERIKYLDGQFVPTIIFHGEKDCKVSPEGISTFVDLLKDLGTDAELYMFQDQQHGFYHKNRDLQLHKQCCKLAAEFMDRVLKKNSRFSS